MFFSVLIPVYNAGKYLEQCLESIKRQTFQDFEVVMVDDGSTDNSGSICDEYLNKDTRFSVYHQENSGVVIARRKALSLARGEYIVWMDSDDYILATALEKIKSIIDNYNCDMVLYGIARTGKNGKDITEEIWPIEGNARLILKAEKTVIYNEMVAGKGMNNLCSKCFKKSLVDMETDYSQWSRVRTGEDLFMLFPIMDKADSVYYLNEILYFYRTVESSITHSFDYSYYYSYEILYNRMNQYLLKWNLNENICFLSRAHQVQMVCDCTVLAYRALHQDAPQEFKRFVADVRRSGLLNREKGLMKHLGKHYTILRHLIEYNSIFLKCYLSLIIKK